MPQTQFALLQSQEHVLPLCCFTILTARLSNECVTQPHRVLIYVSYFPHWRRPHSHTGPLCKSQSHMQTIKRQWRKWWGAVQLTFSIHIEKLKHTFGIGKSQCLCQVTDIICYANYNSFHHLYSSVSVVHTGNDVPFTLSPIRVTAPSIFMLS